jgi:hypothetical protein
VKQIVKDFSQDVAPFTAVVGGFLYTQRCPHRLPAADAEEEQELEAFVRSAD